MIIDLKRTLFPYAHALLMIDGGGSLVPDFQPGPPYLHAPVQLLVIEKIDLRHQSGFPDDLPFQHQRSSMKVGTGAWSVESPVVRTSHAQCFIAHRIPAELGICGKLNALRRKGKTDFR